MRHKMVFGLLVAALVLTSTTATVKAQTDLIPTWVPEKVSDWNLAYNGTFSSGALTLGKSNVKSNWTQVWFKNTSTVLDAVVGVVTVEYNQSFFDRQISSAWKTIVNGFGLAHGMTTFNGTTYWELFKWLLQELSGVVSAQYTEENIPGASGAVSFNFTTAGFGSFYFLVAYKGAYVAMVFALDFPANFWSWILAKDYVTMYNTWIKPYTDKIANGFVTILNYFQLLVVDIPSLAAVENAIEPTGSIVPTDGVQTTEQSVNDFAGIYMGLLAGGIPGYSVFLVGIVSLFSVLVIVQKKRKSIVT